MRLFALLALISATAAARADRAYLEPAEVYLGDVSRLVIEYENTVPSLYALDTSVLEPDFELLGKDSSLSRLERDGQLMHRMQWRLQLVARRSGTLKIPPLRYGDRSTPPLELEVAPLPAASRSSRVFVEIDSDTRSPYVGQQTVIEARLHHAVPLLDASLEPPKAGALQLRRGADDSNYRARRGGQELEVLQRQWLLFPRQAGRLVLPPATFRGALAAAQDPRRSVDGRRRILRRSDALELEVRPPPASFGGRYWLPATQLEISQTWLDHGGELRVGDTLEWSHVIVAHGLPAESLPADLGLGIDHRLGIYADQAERSDRFDNGSIIGRLEQRYAVIVTEPGRIELPAIRLQWWDVVADGERTSVLEGRVFEVGAGIAQAQSGNAGGHAFDAVFGILGPDGLVSAVLLLSLPVVFVLSRPRLATAAAAIDAALARGRWRRRLKNACLSGDPAAARDALIAWAGSRWPAAGVVGLRQIGARAAGAELAALLGELDAALYARDPGAWRGRKLWQSLRRTVFGQRRKTAAAALPPLYPDRGQDSSATRDQPSTGSKRSPYLAA